MDGEGAMGKERMRGRGTCYGREENGEDAEEDVGGAHGARVLGVLFFGLSNILV